MEYVFNVILQNKIECKGEQECEYGMAGWKRDNLEILTNCIWVPAIHIWYTITLSKLLHISSTLPFTTTNFKISIVFVQIRYFVFVHSSTSFIWCLVAVKFCREAQQRPGESSIQLMRADGRTLDKPVTILHLHLVTCQMSHVTCQKSCSPYIPTSYRFIQTCHHVLQWSIFIKL